MAKTSRMNAAAFLYASTDFFVDRCIKAIEKIEILRAK
jgi:hypothetical protein